MPEGTPDKMSKSIKYVAMVMLLLLMGNPCRSDTPPEVVAQGKRATALLEIKSKKTTGTAFCISAAGYFVTSYHLLQEASPENPTLVLDPGEKHPRILEATVVRTDKDADLALLRVEEKKALTPLELGDSDNLIETQSVIAFGYPFGRDLATGKDDLPEVTVNLGQITALRKSQGLLQHIQLDAKLHPGDSGGPLLNEKGQVIGIIGPEVPNTDFHLATPVGRLKAFLDRPEITLTPTNMPFSQATKAQDFHIGLTWFHKSEGAITVTLMAGEENGGERHWTVPLSRAGDYRTKLTLLSPRGGSALLRLTVKTKMDLLTCQVRDHPVTVGHRTIRLSDIQRIELGDRPTAWLVREDPLHEKTSGLDALQATVNGLPATLDLSKADQIVVEEIDPRPNSLPWRVTITQQGHVTGELSGNFVFENTSLPAKRGMILIAAGGTATMTGKFDNGLANRPEDVRRYILNVAVFFMGGRRGRCLIYSDNGVFGDFFRETLQQAGYTVVHDIHPKSLDEYDVVFTGGSLYVDRSALVPYVQRGGKVYLAGGCGQEGPYWADFLRPFGLSIGPDTYMRGADSTPETVRNFGAHSLLQGVNELIFQGISPIHLLPGEWPHVHILVTLRDVNLWAAYIGDPFGI